MPISLHHELVSTWLDLGPLDELATSLRRRCLRILNLYQEELPKRVQRIHALAASAQQDDFVLAVHTMIGSSRSVGAARLANLCLDMERQARSGDLDTPRSMLPHLDAAASGTAAALALVIEHLDTHLAP